MAIERLHADRWLDALGALACRASEALASEQEQVLRTFYHLVCLAPLEGSTRLGSDLSEREFEALIAVSAFETAAFRILGKAFGAMVSFPPAANEWLASVWLPDNGEEKSGRAASLSLALVACTCAALFEAKPALMASRSSAIN